MTAKQRGSARPSLVGFKPTEEDFKVLDDLLEHFQKEIVVPNVKVTNTDILKIAIYELHKSKIPQVEKG